VKRAHQHEAALAALAGFAANRAILEFVGSKQLSAIARFDSAEHFCEGNAAGIKFWFGASFRTNFIGKVEVNIPARVIGAATILKNTLDAGIRKEIGADREETALAHFFELLKAQHNGTRGILLTNRRANTFYIRDKAERLWTVFGSWHGSWDINAVSVENVNGWLAGDQAFSGLAA
jgi:hypothetical protein